MRKSYRVLVMLLGCCLLSGNLQAQKALNATAAEGVATMVIKVGNVKVIRQEKTLSAVEVKKGMILQDGDRVEVGALARAALLMHDGSLIKLSENSMMQLQFKIREKQQNRLKVLIGSLWAKIQHQDNSLEIETPSAVAAIKGTELEIMVLKNGESELIVWDGLVSYYNELGEKMVGAAQRSKAVLGKAPQEPEKIELDKQDQWFDRVVEVPDYKTLNTTVKDKDGKEYKVNIKYKKK